MHFFENLDAIGGIIKAMITIYTQPGCARCRRTKRWLKENNMSFTEKSLYGLLLDEKALESLAEQAGPETLFCLDINAGTEIMSGQNGYLRSMIGNPSALRRPVVVCDQPEEAEKLAEYLFYPESIECPESCQSRPVCTYVRPSDAPVLVNLSDIDN